MADRREHPRLVTALAARYRAEGSVIGLRATLSALSAGGASFIAEEALEPGRTLELRFTLGEGADDHRFEMASEVVRCEQREGIGRSEEFLVAVKFTAPAAGEAERINAFVLQRLARDKLAYNPRIELEKPVAVRFERFADFVQEVSKNLSRTGMFIRSDDPRAPGSEFDFVLQLGDDFSLVQGRAEVVWMRSEPDGSDRPSGMGIRFLSLDKTSENVLRRLIESHLEPSYPRALASTPSPAARVADSQAMLEDEPYGRDPE